MTTKIKKYKVEYIEDIDYCQIKKLNNEIETIKNKNIIHINIYG